MKKNLNLTILFISSLFFLNGCSGEDIAPSPAPDRTVSRAHIIETERSIMRDEADQRSIKPHTPSVRQMQRDFQRDLDRAMKDLEKTKKDKRRVHHKKKHPLKNAHKPQPKNSSIKKYY